MAVCDTDLIASLRTEAIQIKKFLNDERKLSYVSRDNIPREKLPQPGLQFKYEDPFQARMASLRAEALLLKKALDDERKLSCVSRDDIPEPQPRTDSLGHSDQPKPLDNEEKSPCTPKTLQSQSATNPTGPSGHPGRAELTCTLSQDPGLTDKEKGGQGTDKQGHNCGQRYKNSEGHNHDDESSTLGI